MKLAPYLVPLSALKKQVNPLGGELWGCGRIDVDEVKAAAAAGDLEARPWDQVKDALHGPTSRDFHIRRVAYFVVNGLPDDEHKIRLAVDGTDTAKPVRIDNGNHRLAAAMIRRDDDRVEVLLYFFELNDVDCYFPGARPI